MPNLDPTVQSWMQDPEFQALPQNSKVRAMVNYFQGNYTNQAFYELPEDKQVMALTNFVGSHLVAPEKKPEHGIGGGLATFGKMLTLVPKQVAARLIDGIQGSKGVSVVEDDWKDDLVESAHRDIDEFLDKTKKKYGEGARVFSSIPITYTDIASLAENIPYSGITAVTGVGTGLGVGTLTRSPAAAWGSGAAASALIGKRMAKADIMRSYLEAENEEKINTRGKGLTRFEEQALKKKFESTATKHSLWEAIPESAGQVLDLAILLTPLKGMGIGKNIITRMATKLGAMYATETGEEIITEIGQSQTLAGTKMGEKEPLQWTLRDAVKAAKRVGPQVFLLTTLMAGTGAIGVRIRDRIVQKGAKLDTQGDVLREVQEAVEEVKGTPEEKAQVKTKIQKFYEQNQETINKEMAEEGVQTIRPEPRPETRKEYVPSREELIKTQKRFGLQPGTVQAEIAPGWSQRTDEEVQAEIARQEAARPLPYSPGLAKQLKQQALPPGQGFQFREGPPETMRPKSGKPYKTKGAAMLAGRARAKKYREQFNVEYQPAQVEGGWEMQRVGREAQKLTPQEAAQAKVETELPLGKRVVDEVKQPVDAAIAAEKAGRVKIAEKAAEKAKTNAQAVKLADGPEIERLVDEQLGRLPGKIKAKLSEEAYIKEYVADKGLLGNEYDIDKITNAINTDKKLNRLFNQWEKTGRSGKAVTRLIDKHIDAGKYQEIKVKEKPFTPKGYEYKDEKLVKIQPEKPAPAAGVAPTAPAPGIQGAFGGKGKEDLGKLVTEARQIKGEAQETAQKKLSNLSKSDLEMMDVEELDSLFADITMGPGNFQRTMNWKKADFVEAIEKQKLPAKPTPTAPAPAKVTPKEVLSKSEFAQRAKEQYAGWKGKAPKPKEAKPTQPSGLAYRKGKQLPFREYREITKGKNKGKLQVTWPEGRKSIIEKADVVRMPEAPKEAPTVTQAKTRIATPEEKTEIGRIADKLLEWKRGERLTDPENFSSSWTKYDAQKRKDIIRELVDRGELPTSFMRRKVGDYGKSVTSSEILQGLTRKYAIDKFKTPKIAESATIAQAKIRIKSALKDQRGSFSLKSKEGPAVYEDLLTVGKHIYQQGHTKFSQFSKQFKAAMGEVWARVKGIALKLYADVKRILKSERGAVTIKEGPEVSHDQPERLKKLHDTLVGLRESTEPLRQDKYARSINVKKKPESQEAFLKELAAISPEKKTQGWAETEKKADKILQSLNKRRKLVEAAGEGRALDAGELRALNRIYVGGHEKLREIVESLPPFEKMTQEQKDLTAKKISEFQDDIFMTTSDANSEAGRALNILKKEASLRRTDDAIRKLLAKKGGLNERQKAEYLTLNTEDPIAVKRFLDNIEDPAIKEYFLEYWYNAILSGLPTHLVNTISNTGWLSFQVPHRMLTAGIDKLYSRITGAQRERYLNEIVPMLAGYKLGGIRGKKMAWQMVRSAKITEFETKWAKEMSQALGAFERSPHPILRKVAPYLTMPTRLLRGMDVWANAMGYDAHARVLARRASNAKGLKKGIERTEFEKHFIEHLSREAHEECMKQAKYGTFMDDLDPFTNWILSIRKVPVIGTASHFVVPFVRTISNLTKRGLEITPGLGVAKEVVSRKMGRGQLTSEVIAKQIEGLVVALFMLYMCDEDRITGSVPASKAAREAFYRQGKKPWAVKVGDNWYQYRRIEPFNTVLASVAIAHDKIVNAKDDETKTQAFLHLAGSIKNNLIDSSYMQGVQQILDRHERAKGAIQRFTASWVPYSSFSRSVNRAYEAIVEDGAKLRTGNDWLIAWSQTIPGLSGKMPARMNLWGEEIELPGGALRQWLPYKWARATEDKVETELESLDRYPGLPRQTITVRGEEIKIPDKLYREYCLLFGRKAKEALNRLVDKPNWDRLPDKGKLAILNKRLNKERRRALVLLRRELGRPRARELTETWRSTTAR